MFPALAIILASLPIAAAFADNGADDPANGRFTPLIDRIADAETTTDRQQRIAELALAVGDSPEPREDDARPVADFLSALSQTLEHVDDALARQQLLFDVRQAFLIARVPEEATMRALLALLGEQKASTYHLTELLAVVGFLEVHGELGEPFVFHEFLDGSDVLQEGGRPVDADALRQLADALHRQHPDAALFTTQIIAVEQFGETVDGQRLVELQQAIERQSVYRSRVGAAKPRLLPDTRSALDELISMGRWWSKRYVLAVLERFSET
ncbi:MAG: hypothetical protein AAF656_08690, partial [Planctomycetota bacterium]